MCGRLERWGISGEIHRVSFFFLFCFGFRSFWVGAWMNDCGGWRHTRKGAVEEEQEQEEISFVLKKNLWLKRQNGPANGPANGPDGPSGRGQFAGDDGRQSGPRIVAPPVAFGHPFGHGQRQSIVPLAGS